MFRPRDIRFSPAPECEQLLLSMQIGFRKFEQGLLGVPQQILNAIDFRSQPQSQIRRDLIVTTATRVQLATQVANDLSQSRFDK